MKASMLSLHTPTNPGVGSKGHFLFFSKSGHVAYKNNVRVLHQVECLGVLGTQL